MIRVNSKKRLSELLANLGELFDKEISEGLARLYFGALEKYTDEEVELACNKAVRSCTFFPKPAELIQFIEGTPEDRIALAYTQLLKLCEETGAYCSVQFEDPGLEAVVEAWGGWQAICHMPYEDWNFRQRQFRDIYRANMDRPRAAPKVFFGIHDAVNTEKGYLEEVKPPLMIEAPKAVRRNLKLIKSPEPEKEDTP
jgi:hypothetical protein